METSRQLRTIWIKQPLGITLYLTTHNPGTYAAYALSQLAHALTLLLTLTLALAHTTPELTLEGSCLCA